MLLLFSSTLLPSCNALYIKLSYTSLLLWFTQLLVVTSLMTSMKPTVLRFHTCCVPGPGVLSQTTRSWFSHVCVWLFAFLGYVICVGVEMSVQQADFSIGCVLSEVAEFFYFKHFPGTSWLFSIMGVQIYILSVQETSGFFSVITLACYLYTFLLSHCVLLSLQVSCRK